MHLLMSAVELQSAAVCCNCLYSFTVRAESAILTLYSLNIQDITDSSAEILLPLSFLLLMVLLLQLLS